MVGALLGTFQQQLEGFALQRGGSSDVSNGSALANGATTRFLAIVAKSSATYGS